MTRVRFPAFAFGARYAECPADVRISDHNGRARRFTGRPGTDPADVRAKELT